MSRISNYLVVLLGYSVLNLWCVDVLAVLANSSSEPLISRSPVVSGLGFIAIVLSAYPVSHSKSFVVRAVCCRML